MTRVVYALYNCGSPAHGVTSMRKKLRMARQAAGLTQAQLATLVGIDRSFYAHIELGDCNPSLEVALNIASVLGKPIEELFAPIKNKSMPEKEASANA